MRLEIRGSSGLSLSLTLPSFPFVITAGEELLGESAEKDASGNKKLPAIGEYLKKVVVEYFAKHGEEATVKYIDPSYTVRSVPGKYFWSLVSILCAFS